MRRSITQLPILCDMAIQALITAEVNPMEVEARMVALDRFGQIVTAVLAGGRTKPDKELELLLRKLPDNRLVQIVMKTYF